MLEDIPIKEIYDKNINFLIGSGASVGLFPTLNVNIKGTDGKNETIESLFKVKNKNNQELYCKYLFAHYYNSCIKEVIDFNTKKPEEENEVTKNYTQFVETIIKILNRKKPDDNKVCNIFTTNYDGCFEYAFDAILNQKTHQFIVNDGSTGFRQRYFNVNNFHINSFRTGINESYNVQNPQINIIHLHGSLFWHKKNNNVLVDYSKEKQQEILKNINSSIGENNDLNTFYDLIKNEKEKTDNLEKYEFNGDIDTLNKFYEKYQELVIVNPTNQKFSDTLIEPYYYEMLRHLCFELEKPNSILITFGFSFADEHILNMVKRSLSNPTLQMFVCCYNDKEYETLKEIFNSFNNVEFIRHVNNLNFTNFNKDFFIFENKESTKKDGKQ
jgi:hypothetical protein